MPRRDRSLAKVSSNDTSWGPSKRQQSPWQRLEFSLHEFYRAPRKLQQSDCVIARWLLSDLLVRPSAPLPERFSVELPEVLCPLLPSRIPEV